MQTFSPKGQVFGPILPVFVLEKPISAGAKIMYALLCNYASNKDHCWPSHATLAKRLACSLGSVKNYLAELVRENLIAVERERFRSSIYYMLLPKDLERPQKNTQQAMPTRSRSTQNTANPAPCLTPSTAHSSESNFVVTESNIDTTESNIGYINNLNKQSKEEIPPLPPVGLKNQQTPLKQEKATRESKGGVFSFDQDFEKAWEAYPKKEAKALARMAWNSLARDKALPALSVLLKSITHSCVSSAWQREHGRFVPQMSNWLRGQRWLDVRSSHEEYIYQEQQARQKAVQAQSVQEERQKEVDTAKKEALRPLFDAFSNKFPTYNRTMAFGFWQALHNKGITPLATHVPVNNTLNIIEFLQEYKRTHEEYAYRAEHEYATVPTNTISHSWKKAV